ncbi:hypothetical protein RND81_13G038100 [Saponaria officinalis]|uniref:Glycosyltransferase n=1 Tax=Saponaria officinalis TaxID=3572 RepID=A0AAW1H070_SAPOF
MSHKNNDTQLHVAMHPRLAMGHITPFLHIANKLAERGHKISIFLPPKTQLKVISQNHFPELITFVTIALPPVDGLPLEAETTNDVSAEAWPLLMTAIDLTKDMIEAHLIDLKPDFVFYGFTCYWLPGLGRKHGIKSIYYMATFLVGVAYILDLTVDLVTNSLPSFPSPFIKMRAHEYPAMFLNVDFGGGLTFLERLAKSLEECDAIGIKTCKEIEGVYCEHIENNYGKPVLTAGPVIPDPQVMKLDDWVDQWLAGFGSGEVIYCAFGSQCTLDQPQFQELVLGLQLTGRPFLAALKPPRGYETIESALPNGFAEQTKGRGVVYGGWVQQQLILQHPSVGCFLTHCGYGSLSEAMVSKCQLVLVPNYGDQFINARMMSYELKVGVEVDKREEDGFYTREDVQKAVAKVMDEETEVGIEVRANHTKWREFILKDGVEDSYITCFLQSLQQLLE